MKTIIFTIFLVFLALSVLKSVMEGYNSFIAVPSSGGRLIEWVTDYWNDTGTAGAPDSVLKSVPKDFENISLNCKLNNERRMCKYWKNMEKNLPKTIPTKQTFNPTGFTEPSLAKNAAATKSHSISLEYYHDPVGYCSKYPDRYPCPNYWIEDSKIAAKNGKRSAHFPTENMIIPKMKNTIEPQVETICNKGGHNELANCSINDNERLLTVFPDMEDRALC